MLPEPVKNVINSIEVANLRLNTFKLKFRFQDEYIHLLKSIKDKGVLMPLAVRGVKDTDEYEIVDGNQRYLVCQHLGIKVVPIYYLGILSNDEALELAIHLNQHITIDDLNLAEAIAGKNLNIPYTDDERKEMESVINFDWSQYDESDAQPELDL